MRVLVATPGGIGHIHPMVPLAQAILRRGHEVLWAAHAGAIERIEAAGVRGAPAGISTREGLSECWRRNPELRSLPPAELPEVMFGKMFGEVVAPAMLDDLVPVALGWRPDLVVSDQAELAGHIVAAELGVPSITTSFGALLPARRVAGAAEAMAPLWRSRGLEPRPYAGCYDHLYVDIYPPGLHPAEADHVPHHQLMRPVAYDGPVAQAGPDPFIEDRAAGPLVYLTLGTVFNNPEPLQRAVAALAPLGIRLLVTVGPDGDPAALGAQPDHVRVERFVQQTHVFAHADVVVSHGGSGTVLAALARGLPQLCLPQGADQFLNAAAIARSGAGIALAPADASAEAIEAAVADLLATPSYRREAERIRETIEAMPSPDEVAAVLERLVVA